MAKKILKGFLWPIVFIAIYITQLYIINNTTFFGVTGNLCLMAIVLITLMYENKTAFCVAGICGIVSDVLFSHTICKYVLIYVIVVSILIGLKKMYKQDSKMAIIIFSILAVVINEVLMLVFYTISGQELVNIFTLVFVIIKSCIINIFLSFMLYLIFKLFK